MQFLRCRVSGLGHMRSRTRPRLTLTAPGWRRRLGPRRLFCSPTISPLTLCLSFYLCGISFSLFFFFFLLQVYEQYSHEIIQAMERGTLRGDLGWLLPCFSEDITRVLEREVRAIQAEVRAKHKEAAFVEIVPDSSQTAKLALENMKSLFRTAEYNQLTALLQHGNHSEAYKLGCMYIDSGHYEKAIAPLSSCLQKREQMYGKDHPEVAVVLDKIGRVYFQLGDMERAVLFLSRAVTIFQQTGPGEKRLDYADVCESLGMVYREIRQPTKALRLLKISFDVRKELLGSVHSSTVRVLDSLAAIYSSLPVRRAEAVPFLQELLEIRTLVFGEHTREVCGVLLRLASVYQKIGDATHALDTLQRLVPSLHRCYSSNSLTLAKHLSTAGTLYLELRQWQSALSCLRECLDIREKLLGLEHHDVVPTLNRLVALHHKLGIPLPPHWPS
eukprot:m.134966 g.134966  ORF g.134966 m.134966 type:complete len:444 (-) comp20148_c1_seq1:42-1373(-)